MEIQDNFSAVNNNIQTQQQQKPPNYLNYSSYSNKMNSSTNQSIGVQVIFENIYYKTENIHYKTQLKQEKKRQKKQEQESNQNNNNEIELDNSTIINVNDLSSSFVKYNHNFENSKIEKEITILSNVSGIIEKGEMVALFGPSGSGKSTLLDILANRKSTGEITGKILVNGKEIGDAYKKYCSYVTQEEVLLQTCTVEETLKFHADLKLPGMSEHEKWEIVKQVIQDVGLTKKAKSKIGGILPGGTVLKSLSGGEKKRVSIGCALVTNPSLVFLDEPTSGLDSLNALKVIKLLMNLTITKGVTVVCSIHQPRPEIYHLFNKVMIILRGRMLYCGNDVLNYLSTLPGKQYDCPIHVNPADFILDTCELISESNQYTEICENWESKWNENLIISKSNSFNDVLLESTNINNVSMNNNHLLLNNDNNNFSVFVNLYQYRILMKRNLKDFFRNKGTFMTRLSAGVIIGLLFSVCFGRLGLDSMNSIKIAGVLYFLIAVLNLLPFTCVSLFLSNIEVFNSERASKIYNTFPFYLSMVSLEMIVLFIVTLTITTLVYTINHLRWQFSSFIGTFAVLFIVNILSDFVILSLSNLTGKSDLTFIYGTSLSIIFLLFMGFLVPIDELPNSFQWLHYINPLFYGFATIMVVQFKDLHLECNAIPTDKCMFKNGNDVLVYYSLEDWSLALGYPILFLWTIFFFTLGFFALLKLNKEKR